jgi:hypothetical protein
MEYAAAWKGYLKFSVIIYCLLLEKLHISVDSYSRVFIFLIYIFWSALCLFSPYSHQLGFLLTFVAHALYKNSIGMLTMLQLSCTKSLESPTKLFKTLFSPSLRIISSVVVENL